jgi:hypothetical protein
MILTFFTMYAIFSFIITPIKLIPIFWFLWAIDLSVIYLTFKLLKKTYEY